MRTITLPYPPSVNRYWRTITKGARAFPILSREAREYKERMETFRSAEPPMDGLVRLSVKLYRPRKAGDIDGPIKPLLDALQGILYRNDSQIVELRVLRFDDKLAPRVEVSIEAVAPSECGTL